MQLLVSADSPTLAVSKVAGSSTVPLLGRCTSFCVGLDVRVPVSNATYTPTAIVQYAVWKFIKGQTPLLLKFDPQQT